MGWDVPIAVVLAIMLVGCAPAGAGGAGSPTPVPQTAPLWQSAAGGFSPATGSISPNVPCVAISLSLKLDAAAADPPPPRLIGEQSPCRNESIYVGYLRSTLFIEGLDAKGVRLFVATGMNPLHQDVEVPPPPSGGSMSWHQTDTPVPVVATLIRVPVTPALVRLRWYDVDANDQPHLLGEMAWSSPSTASP